MKLASLAATDEGKEKLQHTDVQGRRRVGRLDSSLPPAFSSSSGSMRWKLEIHRTYVRLVIVARPPSAYHAVRSRIISRHMTTMMRACDGGFTALPDTRPSYLG